ncbi:MAG: aldo/keto reductase [Kiritimatiellae bacterium]|nr:aldo/keto reductase [Kiritimatiellia bacterium]
MDRRSFVGALAAFGTIPGTLGVAGCASRPDAVAPDKEGRKFSAWDEVPIGRTGLRTSRLGLGTGVSAHNRSSGIVRRNGHDGAVKLVRAAYEKGIRYFDTADSYGTHSVVREALAPFPRSSYTICTKYWYLKGGIPAEDHTDVVTSVERFLRELGTDYIDIVQIHCVSQSDWPSALIPTMEGLEHLKKAGKIRAHGCSFHGATSLPLAPEIGWLDVAHVQINPFGRSMGLPPDRTLEIVRKMRDAGKGVIGMKVLGVGSLAKEGKMDESIAWVLKNNAADVLNIGILRLEEIDDLARRIASVS